MTLKYIRLKYTDFISTTSSTSLDLKKFKSSDIGTECCQLRYNLPSNVLEY